MYTQQAFKLTDEVLAKMIKEDTLIDFLIDHKLTDVLIQAHNIPVVLDQADKYISYAKYVVGENTNIDNATLTIMGLRLLVASKNFGELMQEGAAFLSEDLAHIRAAVAKVDKPANEPNIVGVDDIKQHIDNGTILALLKGDIMDEANFDGHAIKEILLWTIKYLDGAEDKLGPVDSIRDATNIVGLLTFLLVEHKSGPSDLIGMGVVELGSSLAAVERDLGK